MPYKDPAKARAAATERARRYRRRKHIEKFGPDAGNMIGRHGNHARGERNGRWNNGRMRTSEGYIAIAVPVGHHLRQAHGYAYEHDLVAEKMLGRPLEANEVVHHRNGQRADNRPENLEVWTRSLHAREHSNHPGARDGFGRFTTGKRHDEEFPA